jgi:hypothetical protein
MISRRSAKKHVSFPAVDIHTGSDVATLGLIAPTFPHHSFNPTAYSSVLAAVIAATSLRSQGRYLARMDGLYWKRKHLLNARRPTGHWDLSDDKYLSRDITTFTWFINPSIYKDTLGAISMMEDLLIASSGAIDALDTQLWDINRSLHQHPETAYQEFHAVKTICDFLEQQSISVKRGPYGVETSFEAEYGSGGRLVIFCAEYDALLLEHATETTPAKVAHACGESTLITTTSEVYD